MKKGETVVFSGVEFAVIRRQVRYSRIIYQHDLPKIIIPRGLDPVKIFKRNSERIKKKLNQYLNDLEESKLLPICQYEDEEFEILLKHLILSHSRYLDLVVGEIKFRKMKRRWGTCYSTGRIFLNSKIKLIPQELISYILFHEILHLNILKHDKEFRSLIKERFPDYKKKNIF
jgi:predicted metal-dependent hydrolase